ncbi:4Fe-4S binding protein [Robertmurraya massiliosenegalensis]|uniref:4Fe-4S binding protein n=1 Tax=Robertmurraya TaxID=2837507 RepID=UPI0039A53D57
MVFDQIRKMSNVFLKKLDAIEVDSNKCLKVRAVTSNCTACVDACPANSIEWQVDSIHLKPSCLNCGFCTSVCPTNALKWNHPPLIQLMNQVLRLAKKEEHVYIACPSSLEENPQSNVIEVPCLGMVPSEFWINVGVNAPNVRVIHHSNLCQDCKMAGGENRFMKQKKEAESALKQTLQVCTTFIEENSQYAMDHSRRRFLTSLLEEARETNTITVKEVLKVNKTLSPFEKFDRYYQKQNEMEDMVEEVNEIKNAVVEQVLKDAVTQTDKKALLFHAFKMNSDLQEQMTFSIPEIKESCTRCGACAFLCPTDAITLDNEDIILSTNKCVSCHLCAEICYEKHIHMTLIKGTIFNEKFVYLLQKKE